MGPYERDCPEPILDLLTPTDHEHARRWRDDCRANAAARRARRAKNQARAPGRRSSSTNRSPSPMAGASIGWRSSPTRAAIARCSSAPPARAISIAFPTSRAGPTGLSIVRRDERAVAPSGIKGSGARRRALFLWEIIERQRTAGKGLSRSGRERAPSQLGPFPLSRGFLHGHVRFFDRLRGRACRHARFARRAGGPHRRGCVSPTITSPSAGPSTRRRCAPP